MEIHQILSEVLSEHFCACWESAVRAVTPSIPEGKARCSGQRVHSVAHGCNGLTGLRVCGRNEELRRDCRSSSARAHDDAANNMQRR